MNANSSRDFAIPNGACNIPQRATAFSLNISVVPQGPLGYVTVWPAGERQPLRRHGWSGDISPASRHRTFSTSIRSARTASYSEYKSHRPSGETEKPHAGSRGRLAMFTSLPVEKFKNRTEYGRESGMK